MSSIPYNREFYARHAEGARRSARVIVPLVLERVPAQSVVDIGCGHGTWLSVFRELGVMDVHGVDGDYVDRRQLEIPETCFTALDLSQPFSLNRRFDLVVCLEMAEHVPAAAAEGLIDSLTALGPVVLFSAAIPHQHGEHHVNEQWPGYWAELFAKRGFMAVDALRTRVWRHPDVEWWYAQNTLLYVDRMRLHHYLPLGGERSGDGLPPLDLVHPRRYLELVEWIQSRLGASGEQQG